MIRINRIRIELATEKGLCGFDSMFEQGLNFLTSQENTCGKSSILEAIYYCLGFEEIIGGRSEKVLTSAFKSQVEIDNTVMPVLESSIYLEISNGSEAITLLRSVKKRGRDNHMITIYFSPYTKIYDSDTRIKDTYVHLPNAATNEAGFHSFLERFIGLDLPEVQATDNSQRKLYLQLIFSCMFIEQKHGWSDLFSGMPYLGIRESKKRVVEFVLNLDTLANEKIKEQLLSEKKDIECEWDQCHMELDLIARNCGGIITNFLYRPQIMKEEEINSISIYINQLTIDKYIEKLENALSSMNKLTPKVVEHFDELQNELVETEDECQRINEYVSKCKEELLAVQHRIKAMSKNADIIKTDISNNKDAARLKKLGSSLELHISNNVCPVCQQQIHDSLLPKTNNTPVMDIEENISHLEAQLQTLEYAISNHKIKESQLNEAISNAQTKRSALTKFAQYLRSDLYSVNDDLSESVVYKRIEIQTELDKILEASDDLKKSRACIRALSKRWEEYLKKYEKLPEKGKSENDKKKLNMLRETFINNLKQYGYKSIPNPDLITISDETYLPLYKGFDMKFDSSASDGIRVIWAFTMALLQVSIVTDGNHPSLLVFDEPDQQSTMISDMKAFFDTIVEINNDSQVIVAITLKDLDTNRIVNEIKKENKSIIPVSDKAFQFLS